MYTQLDRIIKIIQDKEDVTVSKHVILQDDVLLSLIMYTVKDCYERIGSCLATGGKETV